MGLIEVAYLIRDTQAAGLLDQPKHRSRVQLESMIKSSGKDEKSTVEQNLSQRRTEKRCNIETVIAKDRPRIGDRV